MAQLVYRVFEQRTDIPDSAKVETRVYMDYHLAVEHVEENDNPNLKRWYEECDE